MNATGTGRYEYRDGHDLVVLTRTFRAPIADVWAAVTESDRLGRWIGTWSGEPTSGTVRFRMVAEGDAVAEQTYQIRACQPPHRLTVHIDDEGGSWELGIELAEHEDVTTLEFTQVISDPTILESVGPGWEYYLDRLVAAETGDDPSAIDFERDYYPALSDHYSRLFSDGQYPD